MIWISAAERLSQTNSGIEPLAARQRSLKPKRSRKGRMSVFCTWCIGCGRVAKLSVIAGSDYLDSQGSEWLKPQLAALARIGWAFHEDLGAYCEACSRPN